MEVTSQFKALNLVDRMPEELWMEVCNTVQEVVTKTIPKKKKCKKAKWLSKECEVKRPLGSITKNKASGGDGIPAELFQILKDYAVKVLHSICQQIQKTQQWPQDWKRSVFIPISKKGNTKECSNYCTIALISYASKLMLKILQARLQQYMN